MQRHAGDKTLKLFPTLASPITRCKCWQVLSQRHGSVISRRTILKSYQPTADGSGNALHIKGVDEIRSEQRSFIGRLGML